MGQSFSLNSKEKKGKQKTKNKVKPGNLEYGKRSAETRLRPAGLPEKGSQLRRVGAELPKENEKRIRSLSQKARNVERIRLLREICQ